MPQLPQIPRYQSLDSYHVYYDNLPIEVIDDQLFIVNSATDRNTAAIEDSIGTVGSLSNRLKVSLNNNGTLKTTAVDDALHSIEEHTDSANYVRMTANERSKLSLIEDSATNLSIAINVPSTTLEWPDVADVLEIDTSDTISWRFTDGKVYADTTFSKSLITIPYYDIKPITANYINFNTTSINTPYKSGTLRVFVNGLRLTNHPTQIGGFYYSEVNPAVGSFSLNKAASVSDVIRIDFDRPLE